MRVCAQFHSRLHLLSNLFVIAMHGWRLLLRYGPSDVVAHYNLGCVHSRDGDAATAGSLFGAALARDDSYGAAWNNWGFVREAAGDVEGAEMCYRKVCVIVINICVCV